MGKEDLIRFKHVTETIKCYSYRYGSMVVPFGCLKALWQYIKQDKYTTKFNEPNYISFRNDERENFELYDYQEEAVTKMIEAKGGVLVASCGSGKTVCGMEIIKRIGQRALWLCHTSDLLRQAKSDLLEVYPNAKIGLTTEGELNIGEDITISTVQTMCNIDPMLYRDAFNVIICDESAHVASDAQHLKMFTKVLSSIPARYKYGLTATPTRADGLINAMYAFLGMDNVGNFKPTHLIPDSKVKKMIATHNMVELNSGYTEDNSDFYDTSGMVVYNDLVTALSDNSSRTDKIIEQIEKCHLEGRKQVVLCLRVSSCEEFVQKLKDRNIDAVLCTGKVKAKNREDILKQRVKWDVLVATYSLLKEGISIKELDTLHLTSPAKEKGMIVQCAGRIERFKEGKKEPIIYDYVDMDIPYCVNAYYQRRRALKSRFNKI